MKIYFFGALLCSSFLFSQVGINTNTPTEILDVKGTLRVRNLPNDGQSNSVYTTGANTTSGTNPTVTFVAGRPLVSDINGVVGQTTFGDLVPNNTTLSNFNTTTNSSSMFMIKRFELNDTQGGTQGLYYTNGFETNIQVDQWQAIMSNVSWKFIGNSTGSQFISNALFNYRLRGGTGGTWKIVGDIVNVKEQGHVDVLFIKNNFVASEDRSQ